jgi:predicted 2-oxoglutarate/Fe(II)-dependent dioxygenase YbiX
MMILEDKDYETLKKFIVVAENVIPNKLCDDIIKEYKKSPEWQFAAVGGNVVNTSIRNTQAISISQPSVVEVNAKVRAKLDARMFDGASFAIKSYNQQFPLVRIEEDSGYDLLRYETGQFYVEHVDSFKQQPRAVSCSFALNDDFEGGEFAFFGRKFKYNLKKGSAIMFPSNFMYPHEVMPVTKGTRYSIITWFI